MPLQPYYDLGKKIFADLYEGTSHAHLNIEDYDNVSRLSCFNQTDQNLEEFTIYDLLGIFFKLLSVSKYHRQFTVKYYFQNEIAPAIQYGQYKIYLTENLAPKAFVTWAWLDKHALNRVQKTGDALDPASWQTGKNLFFNDWIAPYGDVRSLIRDLTDNVFPDEIATSVRHDQNRKLTKVCKWYGKNRVRAQTHN